MRLAASQKPLSASQPTASADAAEALGGLAETGFWEGQSLTARPWLYVL